jgi:environmental stress-induced protein Ves
MRRARIAQAARFAMIRLLTPADYRSMPWKNGGGRTTEIAVSPPGAGLDSFAWRLSVADVGRGGPFSRFPGVDRTIVLLEGAGVRLRGGGREAELTTPFEPYAFSGDDAVDCTLVAGPVRDFNAMFRRDHAEGGVAVVRGGGAELASAQIRLVYGATGAHDIIARGRPAIRVGTGFSLLVETPVPGETDPIVVRPLSADAVAVVVSIAQQ